MKRAAFFLALVAFLVLPGCKGPLPVEPYVSAPPHLFAGTDGNTTVLYGQATGVAGVRVLPADDASLHVLGPVRLEEGRVIVRRRKPEAVSLSLRPGEPLPAWTRHLFTPGEVRAFGLTFQDG